MVCSRCILVVQNELDSIGIVAKAVKLGEVTLDQVLSREERNRVERALTKVGFELIGNKKSRIIEQIKTVVINLVHHQETEQKHKLSDVLADQLHLDYSYLSSLFSEVEGTTIEKYVIAQKIEKVKELLVYDELTLTEIAYRLNYSSVAYLSNQFKKVTGLTPSHFKKIKADKRKALDNV